MPGVFLCSIEGKEKAETMKHTYKRKVRLFIEGRIETRRHQAIIKKKRKLKNEKTN